MQTMHSYKYNISLRSIWLQSPCHNTWYSTRAHSVETDAVKCEWVCWQHVNKPHHHIVKCQTYYTTPGVVGRQLTCRGYDFESQHLSYWHMQWHHLRLNKVTTEWSHHPLHQHVHAHSLDRCLNQALGTRVKSKILYMNVCSISI